MAANGTTDTRRIVLVDDEEALTWSLVSRLAKARPRFAVEAAHEGMTALEMVNAQPTDLLIADVRMPGMSGIDLILAARNTIPDLPVIIMTAFKTPDVQRVAGGPSTYFLEKPFPFERFLQTVDSALVERVGFSGAISVQTLPDIVQLYVLSNATGVLSIRHHGDEGSLWFEHGAITHASTPNTQGEAAFYEIMMWSGGAFGMRLGVLPPHRSIKVNWQELLMESCRLIDEQGRQAAPPRPSRTGWTCAPSALDAAFDDLDVGNEIPRQTAIIIDSTRDERPEVQTMNVKESLAKLNQIDGFVGAALVDSESGMLLGQEGGGNLNLEVAAAGNTEVVKAKRKTMANLQLKETIEDILITLNKQYHIIRPLRSRSTLFFYVALDRSRANLAMARIALADVEKDLQV